MKESDKAWAFNKIKQFLKSIKLSVQLSMDQSGTHTRKIITGQNQTFNSELLMASMWI